MPDFTAFVGNPAKFLCKVSEVKAHYPWMMNYDKGLPWENMGYEKWLKANTKT